MRTSLLCALSCLLLCAGCQYRFLDLPPGNTGRILTPKGWDDELQVPGQVDVGVGDWHGRVNRLVTISAGSLTVEEHFNERDGKSGEDHRLMLKNQTPITCDVYIQVIAPDPKKEKADYDFCYTLVEPKELGPQHSHISIQDIYDRFAEPHVRSGVRGLAMDYADFDTFLKANIISKGEQESEFNKLVATLTLKVFKENKVPLKILGVSVSNIKQDNPMKDATVKSQAVKAEIDRETQRIEKVGDMLKQHPEALAILQWDKLGEVLDKAGRGGHTFIINVGGNKTLDGSDFAPVEHLRKKMEQGSNPPVAEKPAAK